MRKLLSIHFIHALAVSTSLFFVSTGNVFANTIDYGIEVKGQGSVLVEPDNFVLSIAVVEKGRLTDKVRAIVDHKSNQVIDAAKRLGIKDKNINSARVSLYVIKPDKSIDVHGVEVVHRLPNNQKSKVHVGNSSSLPENNNKPLLFELSRNITVTFSDIKDYDQFLNSVIKIGVNQISPLSMSVNDTDKYYQQALIQALKTAKVKALQIAKQSGQKLGKLVSVKEVSSNHYRARFDAQMMSSKASFSHNSQVGNQSISANVIVKYLIE
jgi:uncharacterized protein YggE